LFYSIYRRYSHACPPPNHPLPDPHTPPATSRTSPYQIFKVNRWRYHSEPERKSVLVAPIGSQSINQSLLLKRLWSIYLFTFNRREQVLSHRREAKLYGRLLLVGLTILGVSHLLATKPIVSPNKRCRPVILIIKPLLLLLLTFGSYLHFYAKRFCPIF